ncbi:MAG: hypothetical protein JWR50_820 [Mucilaginibacter sp.]|nr:hypothetical protein [Mucilaginibacter sp.]
MKKIEILTVGKHPEIMKTILRLINSKPEWNGTIAYSATEAIAGSQTTAFDVVLLCAGLDEVEAQQLKAHFKVPIVQHYGGGSGLLFAEIYQALGV